VRARRKKSTTKPWPIEKLPEFTFHGIKQFLGEFPKHPKGTTFVWNNFSQIFPLLWDPTDQRRQWTAPYLQGYENALRKLALVRPGLPELLKKKVEDLFQYYCPIIPAVKPSRCLTNDKDKRPVWYCFDRSGRIDPRPRFSHDSTIPDPQKSWFPYRYPSEWDSVFHTPAKTIVRPGQDQTNLLRQRRTFSFECYNDAITTITIYRPPLTDHQKDWLDKQEQVVTRWMEKLREYERNGLRSAQVFQCPTSRGSGVTALRARNRRIHRGPSRIMSPARSSSPP
jgi:hypothetical protein